MYLRSSPDLHLKQLVIGGLDRVYEISKSFRNEMADSLHNIEFTTCDAYCGNLDYNSLIELNQELLRQVVKRIHKSYTLNYQEKEIDLSNDFAQITLLNALEEKLGCKLPKDLESEEIQAILEKYCQDKGFHYLNKSIPQLMDMLIDKVIGPALIAPTYVTNLTRLMTPLAKTRPDNPQLAESTLLFIGGIEICRSQTEGNDPNAQLDRLVEQSNLGDEDARYFNREFFKALEYGAIPMGGLNMGIDRLVMLMMNLKDIRDVVTFPII